MTNTSKPRIGVIGTGGIGGFYGLMLQNSGLDVRFLVRSGQEELRRDGMSLRSESLGDIQHQVQVCSQVEELDGCDWILVSTKTTGNAEVARLLNRLPNPAVKVVLLQNGYGNEEQMRALVPAQMSLFAGLCFIQVRRTAPGQIWHQGGGAINIGYHSGADSAEQGAALAAELAELFAAAKVPSEVTDAELARWQKLVWNVPYNGLSVVLDANTSSMMDNPSCLALITDLMQEVVDAAATCGYVLPEKLMPAMLKSTRQMDNYYPSMHGDYTGGKTLELQAIYRAPLQAARTAGGDMPKVAMLLQQLEFIQARSELAISHEKPC